MSQVSARKHSKYTNHAMKPAVLDSSVVFAWYIQRLGFHLQKQHSIWISLSPSRRSSDVDDVLPFRFNLSWLIMREGKKSQGGIRGGCGGVREPDKCKQGLPEGVVMAYRTKGRPQ
jgi:hypothetical protein